MKYLLILLLLFSCQSSDSSTSPEIGESFTISYQDSIMVKKPEWNLKFAEVLEDSRCPEGAQCPWAGNAKIRLTINGQNIELNSYSDPKQAAVDDYQITLEALSPYPKQNETIAKEAYRAKLRIDQKP
jgi:hypothetical protein